MEKKERLTEKREVRLDRDTTEWLRKAAREEERSESAIIRRALHAYRRKAAA